MRLIFTLLLLLSFVFLDSCKKDNIESKPSIADIPFVADIMRSSADSTYTDVPDPCVLLMNSDMTWTLDLKGAKSSGVYSWTPTTKYTAQIKFQILEWTIPTSDTARASKLKMILQSVDKCFFTGPPIYGGTFSEDNKNTILRVIKQ